MLHKTKDNGLLYNCNFHNDTFIANAVDLLHFVNATIMLNYCLRILTALDDHGPNIVVKIVRSSHDPVAAVAGLYFSHETMFDLTE